MEPTAIMIRPLTEEELPAAADLMWEVFLQFEAPEYSEEGVRTFREFVYDTERRRQMQFYGAFDSDMLVGTLSVRAPQHISGFFVRADYHRRGVGRALFERMLEDYSEGSITVNSSPYAVEVYRHLGFTPTDAERLDDGIRYTPMEYQKSLR